MLRRVRLNVCTSARPTSGIPIIQYDGYESRAQDGTTFVTTALDVAEQGDTPTMYLLDVGQACAQVINTVKLNLHGFKLARPTTTQR